MPPGELGCNRPDGEPEPGSAAQLWLPELVDRIASFVPCNDVACNSPFPRPSSQRTGPPPPLAASSTWANDGTAASGVVENLAAASQAAGCRLSVEFLLSAAAAGRIECCRWLLAPGRFQPEFKDFLEVICAAARFRSLPCCRWLAEHCRAFKPLPPDWGAVLEAAAASGDKAICQWCLDRSGGEAWSDAALRAALRRGHVALAEWLAALHDAQWSLTGSACLAAAAKGCDAATFRRLCGQSGSVRSMPRFHLNDIFQAAVTSRTPDWRAKADLLLSLCPPGEAPGAVIVVGLTDPGTMLERLTWLQDHGFPLRGTTGVQCLAAAVEANSKEAVEWLLDAGVWPDDKSEDEEEHFGGAFGGMGPSDYFWLSGLRAAARKGNVDVLRLLAEEECVTNPQPIAEAAAAAGCLPVLELLDECFGPWSLGGFELFEAGVSSGSLEVMAWLKDRPDGNVTPRLWLSAAASGSEAALELLALTWDCPPPEGGEPYPVVMGNGDMHTCRVLRRLGAP
ncbi:hypothetical protein HYH03_005781 [Edaphochlamys debaryana]|uniref:Ankyrin repeat domain-containing protein n=1 Tax=Edaphochlamys debaryana TaxID=47281 RepID=A0A836C0T5_9CHLO|nr:hypothetical protein HYH03_005781 [Edaphochlamys debaryana]|eukprot:KAG2496181.1 hypothetical protein HYH03_005781 [Edaphochlamys debaryana]